MKFFDKSIPERRDQKLLKLIKFLQTNSVKK